MLDFTFQAFDLADQYRTPVMVLSDGRLGQMMEPVELRDPPAKKRVEKPWALIGAKGRPAALPLLAAPAAARAGRPQPRPAEGLPRDRAPRAARRIVPHGRRGAGVRRPTAPAPGSAARRADILRDEGLEGGPVPADHPLAVPRQETAGGHEEGQTHRGGAK